MHKSQIRRLLKTDLDSFMTLRLESLKISPDSFLSTYEEEKSSGRDFFEKILSTEGEENAIFGAYIDQKLVGIMGIYQILKTRTKHKSTIWGVYTSPEYRGQGIAKSLMEAVIAHAKNNMKCAVINISTAVNNLSAKKLYHSCGFKTWGIEPAAFLKDGKFSDEEHMVLKLIDSKK